MSDPFWFAQRHGQDWQDDDCLAAIDWLTRSLPAEAWAARMEAVEERFAAAKVSWAEGDRVALYDPADQAAWYVFQARAYAMDRENWFEPEAYRIAPLFRRIGQLLPELSKVVDVDARVLELMTRYRRQPDDGIYELLVAAAYRKAGWTDVAFVPAERERRRPDLFVSRGRSQWAAECKRVGRSDYGEAEREHGHRLARGFHAVCERRGLTLAVQTAFAVEAVDIPEDYLAERAEAFVLDSRRDAWDDAFGAGWIRPIDRRALDAILTQDDIFFGSSRMVQLIEGVYSPSVQYDLQGDWTPARNRPLHATAVGRISLVASINSSQDAQVRKAKHFRKLVRNAADQLPGDRPGVVHVGYEAFYDDATEALRHVLNRQQARDLDVGTSRLRYVYANYLAPEHTTDRMEASALTETTATYHVGRSRSAEPLRHHTLFSEDSLTPGAFWARPR